MNKAVITGRLGEDAEIIDTKNGKIMVKLIVATRDMDETDWHQVKIVNDKLAMTCKKCSKGMIVSVSGKLKTRKHRQTGQFCFLENAQSLVFLRLLAQLLDGCFSQ